MGGDYIGDEFYNWSYGLIFCSTTDWSDGGGSESAWASIGGVGEKMCSRKLRLHAQNALYVMSSNGWRGKL